MSSACSRFARHFAPPDAPARVVGVIASLTALARARRLRQPPDFFELRLDALRDSLGEVARALPKLRAPLILTARHPAEGGTGALHSAARRELLLRFLEHAACVDLELRSVRQMRVLIEEIQHRQIGLIISRHDFARTSSGEELRRLTKRALTFRPDIFKIVIRTDTPAELDRLVSFVHERRRAKLPLAAMGAGKFGLTSRLQLDRFDSALTYVSLREPNVEGQLTLAQLRRARRAYIR